MKYKNESGWSMMGMVAGIAMMGALSFGAGMALADTMQGNKNVGQVKQAVNILRGYKANQGTDFKSLCQQKGGTYVKPFLEDKPFCCKGGYQIDVKEVMYNGEPVQYINPDVCKCPGNIEPTRPSLLSDLYCCKNGFEIGANGKYDQFNQGRCGCPGGIKPNKAGYCCQNGMIADPSTGEYKDADATKCGCPDKRAKIVNGKCCLGLQAYAGSKGWLFNATCGCTEGVHPKKNKSGIPVCCKNGFEMNPKTGEYNVVNTSSCKCPGNIEPTIVDDIEVCCKDGKMMDEKGNYTKVNPQFCGCPPDGHEPKKEGYNYLVCCQNGLRWDYGEERYTRLSPETCGCPPDGHKPQKDEFGSFCCQNGKAWNDNTKRYDTNNSACCPEPKPAGPYICEDGKWVCTGSEAGGKCTGYGDTDGHFES